MKLTVVRHGETIENAQDVVMGHHGGNLSEKGIQQVEAAATSLKKHNFDQAWSSDLKRCVDTARIILKHHPQLNLQVTPALREVNYGEFQGSPASDIRDYFEKEGFNKNSKVPGGESHTEMGVRTLIFVNDLLEKTPDESILLISHNGPIEAIREAVEGTPFSGDSLNGSIRAFEINKPLKIK